MKSVLKANIFLPIQGSILLIVCDNNTEVFQLETPLHRLIKKCGILIQNRFQLNNNSFLGPLYNIRERITLQMLLFFPHRLVFMSKSKLNGLKSLWLEFKKVLISIREKIIMLKEFPLRDTTVFISLEKITWR